MPTESDQRQPRTQFTVGAETVINDPSPQQINESVRDIHDLLPDDFLVLERLEDKYKGCSVSYLQATPKRVPTYEGTFTIEYRDGLLGLHYRAHVESYRVAGIFVSYLRDDEIWQKEVAWVDCTSEFGDLLDM